MFSTGMERLIKSVQKPEGLTGRNIVVVSVKRQLDRIWITRR